MEAKTIQGKIFEGTVVKTAMKDTATVLVERYVKHPKYKKYIRRGKKFLAHDPGSGAKVGDKVTIRETKPISRRKRFVVTHVTPGARMTDEAGETLTA